MRRTCSIPVFALAASLAGCAAAPGAMLSAESLASGCAALSGRRIEASRCILALSSRACHT